MRIRKLKNSIGRKILDLRKSKGLSQEQISGCVNITREHISCLENGKHLVNIETLYK